MEGHGAAGEARAVGGEGEGAHNKSQKWGEACSSLHFETIEELSASLQALKGDPLEADGGRVVVYRGSPSARIMLIGQGCMGSETGMLIWICGFYISF